MKLIGLDTEDAEAYEKMAQNQDKKRRFMNELRPGKIWNFFEDCADELKTEHVLRYDANPMKAYEDGRIEAIMANIEEIAMNLKSHNEEPWNMLKRHVMDVFKMEEAELKK